MTRSWFESSPPVSGSVKLSSSSEAIATGGDQDRPSSLERVASSVPVTLRSEKSSSSREKTVSSVPSGRTSTSPDWSSPFGGARSIVAGADQVAPPSVVRANRNESSSGKSNRGSRSAQTM